MRIGAQFWTIRDYCRDLNSFAESMKKIADIGYEYIQVSGTCDFPTDWLKGQLEENGLKCVLTHTPPARLTGDASAVARDHDIFGCDNVGLGFYKFETEDIQQLKPSYDLFVETYKPVAKALKENGKYFMFHNHAREFAKIDGQVILEKIANEFALDELGVTLDTYWVQNGGGDPAYWLERLKNRVPVIHLKDHTFDGKMAVVGEGNINFDRVFSAAETAGTEYMLVEQDDCYGEDPFACLKRSYDNLVALGFK